MREIIKEVQRSCIKLIQAPTDPELCPLWSMVFVQKTTHLWMSLPLPSLSHDFGHFVPFDQVANNFGLVCIVTNAVPGWVEKTIKKLVIKAK